MEFKPGNIVKMIDTYWHGSLNESRKDIGKLFVIEYSYGEKYGNGKCYGGYSILSMENGSSSSWWNDNQLEFVEDGSVDLINELKRKYEEITNQSKDIKWIKEHFSESLPTDSILTLFHKIGYESAFEQNGEFYCLVKDWLSFYPVFLLLFDKKFDSMIKILETGTNEKYRDKYLRNFTALYNEIHGTDKKVGE